MGGKDLAVTTPGPVFSGGPPGTGLSSGFTFRRTKAEVIPQTPLHVEDELDAQDHEWEDPDTVFHPEDCHAEVNDDGTCGEWCHSCGRCEPQRAGDFRMCPECWHVYRTADDLLQAWAKFSSTTVERLPLDTRSDPARYIFACPLCGHDF